MRDISEADWTLQRHSMLARSLAGHDKGSCYLVLAVDEDGYLLSDGNHRPLDKPKRKNAKHVQVIRHLPEEVQKELSGVNTDADVRRILHRYKLMTGKD